MAVFNRQCFVAPIPNDPFYYPETDFLCRQAGPVIVGSGLCINYPGDLITAGTLTSIDVDTASGLCTIPPGPITTEGTIALANTAVIPGVYEHASFIVDAQGRLTGATTNPAPIPCCAILQKGDLLAGTAPATPTALPVGSAGSVLTADPSTPTGLVWAAPGSFCYGNLNVPVFLSAINATGVTYAQPVFSAFGTGLYPVMMTANLEVAREGITRLTGSYCLISSVSGPTSPTCFGMVGGALTNRLFTSSTISWIFPPSGSPATYCASITIDDNAGPTDVSSTQITNATIQELR